MSLKPKFIVVDDHPLYRAGVCALITQELNLECAGEASDAQEAMELIERTDVALAIIDISLKRQSGLDLVHALKASHPRMLMVVLSMHEDSLYGERALKAGARGYVMKHQPPQELVAAVRTVLSGGIAVSDGLKNRLFEGMLGGRDGSDPVRSLSDREFEVFTMIGRGMGAAEIAEQLHLSVKTVNTHQDHIKEKLGIPSAGELRKYAVDWTSRPR
mgnify:CR=1 FL=1